MHAEGVEIQSENEAASDIADTPTVHDVKEPKPASPAASNAPLLAWSSIIKTLADAEPVTAAGVGGVVVILVLWIFGRVGSLIVGVLAGVLLHASLERKGGDTARQTFVRDSPPNEVKVQQEKQLDVIPPKTNLALRYFWDLLIRDYVDWWFSPLSTDNEFPSACRRSLEFIASSFASHVQSKVPAEIVLLTIMSASSTLIVFFRELRSASLETDSAAGVAEYIKNNPDSALAQLIDEKFQQEKLRHMASRMLATFASKTDRECEAGLLFAREMLAMQVFNLTATSCSTSSYINWFIVETFKEVQDQGGLLGNDSRAREAEEAMARAAAEAAEMTRLLEEERSGKIVPVPTEVSEVSPPTQIDTGGPRTTFASILANPNVLPAPPDRVDMLLQQSNGLPPPPDRIDEIEASMRNPSVDEPQAYTNTSTPIESPARLSSTSLRYDEPPQETLQGANISLMDLSTDAGTGKAIRQKSTLSYMITIEPLGGRVPGWVAIKQFVDFESLHEVLRRLANVSGILNFPSELPEWKGKLHQPLADELEHYLKIALSKKQLADSEAMKRFFGKEITDQSLAKKKNWPPLKGVGEGMRDVVLSSAEGSQKLFSAAWATTGISKKRVSTPIERDIPRKEASLKDIVTGQPPTPDEDTAYHSPLFRESATFSPSSSTHNIADVGLQRISTSSSLNGYSVIGDGGASNSASTTSLSVTERLVTPPEDSEPDTPRSPPISNPENHPEPQIEAISIPHPRSNLPPPLPPRPEKSESTNPKANPPPLPERPKANVDKASTPELSANDAQQILDIGFSILSEFYALSPRTWMIRKSLLNLLKSLLISNGRTYIETIRTMIQEDLINKCLTSDAWYAGQVKAVTESMWPSVPWPAIDDEAYKIQAKELFMTKMLPETMRGLMGGAATSQALEVVFEALQDQRVAKGLMVALMCDVIRALQV